MAFGTPIQGPSGKVTQGTADAVLLGITDWSGEASWDVQKLGPFLNDGGVVYKTRTSLDLKGTFKGVTPSGKDTNQTAVLTALTGGTDLKVTLLSIGGYSIVCTTMLINSIKLGHDAKGSATFEAGFEANGTFTAA